MRVTACLLALLFAWPAQAQIPETVAKKLREAGIPETAVSLWSRPVDGGKLMTHRPAEQRNTASVMKLLTTFAALDLLGPAYTWRTDALSEQPVRNGTLSSPLILRGSGDPFLTWDRFAMLVRELHERGLQHVDGGLVIDRSSFAPAETDDFDDKPARAYNARPDGVLLNFNAITIRLRPSSNGVVASATLPLAGLTIDNRLKQQADAPCIDWKNAVAPRIEQLGETLRISLPGQFPASCGEKMLNLAIPDATHFAAGVFRALWDELGGSFKGPVSEATTPATAQVLASWDSPPLAEILREQDKYSNNVMARQVFLSFSSGNGTPATEQGSIARLQQWMPSRGLDPARWSLENGSGLSREERTSAEQLGALLLNAWASPRMPDFVAALPIVGVDGTMKKRLADTPIAGRGYVKTGTLDGVKTAAGYMLDAKGRWRAFVWMINHPRAEAGDAALDALLENLYANPQ
jgi:D-alanyl-D-alanine carboxypeptidase/D-alanyl-D-alanine-endopeptidase (penicillin-binding protein 4)